MDYAYCPRCGTRRDERFNFDFCRHCGFDFPEEATPKNQLSGGDQLRGPIDVRPIGDRRDMARWTRDAFTVRCLGMFGGIVGAIIGFFAFAMIGGALGWGAGSLVLALLGIFIGFFFGVRVALGLAAR